MDKKINKETLNYDEIRALSETDAARIAMETMEIKDFNVYFIDFGPLRGYSYIVFKNEHQIIDDFANLHSHILKEKGLAGLRKYYIEAISNKLFTEEEIAEPLKSYDDYRQKSYFLHNYYAKQENYVSMFRIFRNDEDEKAFDEEVKDMIFNRVGFCYMDKSLKSFVDKHVELMDKLNVQKENVADNYEYQKSAFLFEMFNHEYGINGQRDWDVLSCFGNVIHLSIYDDLDKYFDTLKFTETQRKAYMDARTEYYKKCSEEEAA